jgi:hypothetical protein
MVNKKKPTREHLKNLCIAHSQLINAQKEHRKLVNGSQHVMDVYDREIQELEKIIAVNLKAWLSLE